MGGFIVELSARETGLQHFVAHQKKDHAAHNTQAIGGWMAGAYGFKIMLLAAGIFYFIAMIMRLSMAREAAKTTTTKTEKLSFSSLKTNLVSMFGLIFSGGLITWMLVTDGMRDISFQFSENLFPVYMQEVGGLSLQQIGWVMSFFGLAVRF